MRFDRATSCNQKNSKLLGGKFYEKNNLFIFLYIGDSYINSFL